MDPCRGRMKRKEQWYIVKHWLYQRMKKMCSWLPRRSPDTTTISVWQWRCQHHQTIDELTSIVRDDLTTDCIEHSTVSSRRSRAGIDGIGTVSKLPDQDSQWMQSSMLLWGSKCTKGRWLENIHTTINNPWCDLMVLYDIRTPRNYTAIRYNTTS